MTERLTCNKDDAGLIPAHGSKIVEYQLMKEEITNLKKTLYEDCKAKENGDLDVTWSDLASKHGVLSGKILADRWYRIKSKPNPELEDDGDIENTFSEVVSETQPNTEEVILNNKQTIEYNANGTTTSEKLIKIFEADSKNPIAVMVAHGLDPQEWQVVSYKNNMWNMPRKDNEPYVMLQSKITVKPLINEWTEDKINKLFKGFENKSFEPVKIVPSQYSRNGKSLLVPIADLHIGLLATMQANNNEYNMEIMENLYRSTISQIKERIIGQKFEEVIFVVGNDFLNTDNLTNTTSKGTPQDSAAFWYSLVDKAIELIIVGINSFLEVAPVYVYNAVSNHDGQTMYGIMKVIEATYKSNMSVWVDTSPLPRKYHKFGKSLVAITHDMKVATGLQTMTTEAKHLWSSCNKFYWFLAHLHTEMQYQKSGMMEMYRVPTISGYSRWSNDKAFVNTEKKTQCFIIDEEHGVLDTMYIIVG